MTPACLVASLVMLVRIPLFAQTPFASASAATPDAQDLINADRPGIADGSTVVGGGRVQLETGFQQEFRDRAGTSEQTRFLPSLLRIGFSAQWEARIEGNTYTHDGTSTGDQTSDFAPISVGVKFHIQDSAGFHKPSLGTILRVFPASGTGALHTSRPTGDLRFVADWDMPHKLSVNPNAGVAVYEGDTGETFVAGLSAVTLNYFNEAKTLNPFVDFALLAPEGPKLGSGVIVDAGMAYVWGHDVQIDASAGLGPHGRTPPHRFVAVGLAVRFRPFRHST